MISKKQALILGAAAIAGTGVALMVLKGKEGDEGGEEETKKDMMLHYEAPIHAPTDIYAPYSETRITDIVHNIITNITGGGTPPAPSVNDSYQGYGSLDAMLKGHSQEKVGKKIARLKEEAEAAGTTSTAAERSAARYAALEALSRGGGGGGGGSGTKPKPRKPTTYRATPGGGQVAI